MTPHTVTEEEKKIQDMESRSPTWTICETIREIYHLADEIRKQPTLYGVNCWRIMDKAREATVLAKRMEGKLRNYHVEWDRDFWDQKIDGD